jgi:hypothetical protein
MQDEDRDERQGESADLRPELADRLRRPQAKEVAVTPEDAGCLTIVRSGGLFIGRASKPIRGCDFQP